MCDLKDRCVVNSENNHYRVSEIAISCRNAINNMLEAFLVFIFAEMLIEMFYIHTLWTYRCLTHFTNIKVFYNKFIFVIDIS